MTTNKVLRNVLIGGFFFVPFIPLIVASDLFFPFITGKHFAFRVLIELLFGGWLILALRDPAYRPKKSWIFRTLFVFLGVILIANLLGLDPSRSFWSNFERMEGYITLLHLGAYFFVASSVLNSERLWRLFFHTSLGVSLFIALYGILQLTGELRINQGGVRLDATLGNATYLGVYMLFHVFLSIFLYMRRAAHRGSDILVSYLIGFGWFVIFFLTKLTDPRVELAGVGTTLFLLSAAGLVSMITLLAKGARAERQWVERTLFGALLALQGVTLYFTATRGVILGLLVGVLAAAVLLAFFARERKGLCRIAVALLVGVAALVALFVAVKDAPFVKENDVLSRFASLSLSEAAPRFRVWDMGWQGFKEQPLLGYGQGNFGVVFNKFYDPQMYSQEPWFDRAHNIVFDWLSNGGLLGLAAYLALFTAPLVLVIKNRTGAFSREEKVIVTGLFAAYFFSNLFVFDNLTSYILFFSVLAYVHTSEGQARAGGLWEKVAAREDLTTRVIFPVILVATLVLVYALNAKPFLTARTLIRAMQGHEEGLSENRRLFEKAIDYDTVAVTEVREQLVQAAIQVSGSDALPEEERNEFVAFAIDEMRKEIEERPLSARSRLFLGTFVGRLGDPQEGVEILEGAQTLSPRKQAIAFEIGIAKRRAGDIEGALATLREAFDAAPEFVEARIQYAVAAIYAGDMELVEDLLVPVYGSVNAPEDRIVNAYFNTGRFSNVVAIWERRVESEPTNIQFRMSLAGSYLQTGEPQRAIAELERAIEIDPAFREQGDALIEEIRAGIR